MGERIQNKLFYPMLVSETGTDAPLPQEQNAVVWKKYLSLSQKMRDIITDAQIQQKLARLQELFGLGDQEVGKVSLAIRKLFFQDWAEGECANELNRLLPSAQRDPALSRKVVDFIKKEIYTIEPRPEPDIPQVSKISPNQTVSLPLLQALSKYMQLSQHQVTREKIKLKTQVEPVRPTLINWLRYYRSELGIGYHNSVERGEFLYQSENCRKLSSEERERISLLLKSVEDSLPLTIDLSRFEIVFPTQEQPLSTSKPPLSPLGAFISRGAAPFPPPAPQTETEKSRGDMRSESPRTSGPAERRGFPLVPFQAAAPLSQGSGSEPPGGLRFSTPHVFQAEKELQKADPFSQKRMGAAPPHRKETAQRSNPGQNLIHERAPQSQGGIFVNPPLAPLRQPGQVPKVLHQNPSAAFNRFNITPLNMRQEEDKNA